MKEVANHANDIMKQGVRPDSAAWETSRLHLRSAARSPPVSSLSVSQDNFQKLMHIQYSLTGHHEIVQPGRVSESQHGSTRHRKVTR